MARLLVDTGWNGSHGIGRYAREVTARLDMDWVRLRAPGRPGSARNLLTPRVARASDLIYSPGYNGAPSGARQFVTVHDLIHLIEPSPRYRAYYHALLRPIVKRSGLVFTVSETSRALISRWIDDDSVRIVNTGNGCSSAFRRATPVAERRGLVYVGNLKAHKNFEVVLDALRLLEGVELVAVTPDPAGTKALAKLKGVDSQVVVASGLSDAQLANLYARSCASVLPSKMEGFGLPAVESLATRTPVIYWAGCEAVAEVVGANGAAVGSADDPVQWAEAIRFALAEPVEVAEDATSRYEWDSVAGVVNATLLDYLDGGSVVA